MYDLKLNFNISHLTEPGEVGVKTSHEISLKLPTKVKNCNSH